MDHHTSAAVVEAAGINVDDAKLTPAQVTNLATRIMADTFVQHQRVHLLDRGIQKNVAASTVIRSMSPAAKAALRTRVSI